MTPRSSTFAGALFVLAGLVASPDVVTAQTLRVELEVTGSGAEALEPGFRSALERLEGVEPAGAPDLAHYALTVTVLCIPDSALCDAAESYTVSVVLSEPVTPGQLSAGLSRTGDDILESWRPTPEARAFLQRYRRIHAVWAADWSAGSWERDVERLVRGIDARCFQQRRVVEARRESLLQRGDTAAARNLPSSATSGSRALC